MTNTLRPIDLLPGEIRSRGGRLRCGRERRGAARRGPNGSSYPGAMPRIRVAAAQLNLVVGDLDGNETRILEAYDRAAAVDADLVAFPELAVTGYPPEDLLLRPAFVAHAAETLAKIAAHTGTTAAVVGFPEPLGDGA